MDPYYFSERLRRELRFCIGSVEEVRELFGAEHLLLPEEERIRAGAAELFVELPHELSILSKNYLQPLFTISPSPIDSDKRLKEIEWKYLELMEHIISNTIRYERRSGLLNLFWLSYAKAFSRVLNGLSSQKGVKVHIKYQIHPMVSGLFINAVKSAMININMSDPGLTDFNLGADFNDSIIHSIINDQLSLTESDISKINLQLVLIEQNRRYTMPFKAFNDIYLVLQKGFTRMIQSKDRTLLSLIKRHAPEITEDKYLEERNKIKFFFNRYIINYLLSDYELVGKELTSNPSLMKYLPRFSNWSAMMESYKDTTDGIKRSEIIKLVQLSITLTDIHTAQEDVLFSAGRLYRFSESTRIINNACKVAVIFADLREFTKTSERGFSEKEITDQLYTIFDPITNIVASSQGKIDKFTGDGVMITFGAFSPSKDDSLKALRTAILIQRKMAELRRDGKTFYKLGISAHIGRAYVADFMLNMNQKEVTVIGRNVNLAGRLSSAKGNPKEEAETEEFKEMVDSIVHSLKDTSHKESFKEYAVRKFKKKRTVSGVTIDEGGNLYNMGIAVTADVLDDIINNAPPEKSKKEGSAFSYFDPVLNERVFLDYVGDVIFKGIEKSLPIYSVLLRDVEE